MPARREQDRSRPGTRPNNPDKELVSSQVPAETAKYSSGPAGGSGGECCHPDRDEQAGQLDSELGDVAGRWLGRKPPRVFLIQAREVGWVGEQHPDLGDVFQAGAPGLEDGLAVRQCQ
jgi:hypothetical protein